MDYCKMEKDKIDTEKWDKLIFDYYKSACDRNKYYSRGYTIEKVKKWWYELLENNDDEKIVQEFIEGWTQSNYNGYKYYQSKFNNYDIKDIGA